MEFSYDSYKELLIKINKQLPIVSWQESFDFKRKCVIRHDVEFSPARALALAKEEARIGVYSTYCFQVRNNCYNILSDRNVEIVRQIISLGHTISAHVHMGQHQPLISLDRYIKQDIDILEQIINDKLIGFCFHRPKMEHLLLDVIIPGYINFYSSKYFTLFDNGAKLQNMRTVYLSDSNHKWKWGNPNKIDLSRIDTLQLNFHPYNWHEKDLDNSENFAILTNEKRVELVESMNSEITNYPKKIYEEECNFVDWS